MKIENKEQYRGVYSLLLTPFNEDLSIDYDGYAAYVELQAAQNPHFLFSVCGSSEMTTLTLEERIKVATTAAKYSGDVPVFATANLEPTWFSQVEEVKKMEQTGVAGLVFTSNGYGNDDDRMVTYMQELASKTRLPVMIYEFPGFKNSHISGKAYGEIAKIDNIIGIKDTTCTVPKIKDKIDVQGETAVLQANIPYLLKAYEEGGRGVVATPSSCGAAKAMRKMYDAFFVEKDYEAAKKYFEHVCIIDNGIDSGFMVSAKYLCQLQGVPMKPICRDGRTLSESRCHGLKVFCDYAKANGIL